MENIGVRLPISKSWSPIKEREYVVVSLSRIMKRDRNAALSVMLGFELNTVFQRKAEWAFDSRIRTTQMDFDRSGLKQEEDYQRIRTAMQQLMDHEKNMVAVSGHRLHPTRRICHIYTDGRSQTFCCGYHSCFK